MATSWSGSYSDSNSDYGYDLSLEDEELLCGIIDSISPLSSVAAPTRSKFKTTSKTTTVASPDVIPAAPDAIPVPVSRPIRAISTKAAVVAELALENLTEDDLAFDISELEPETSYCRYESDPEIVDKVPRRQSFSSKRRLSPSVAEDDAGLASYVSRTKAKSTPTVVPDPEISYPDLSRALSEAESTTAFFAPQEAPLAETSTATPRDTRAPILRFRTSPWKTFSVSDLVAGAWCELQYYYTLSRLPGGRKLPTEAMKRGSGIHETLERQVYTTVEVDVKRPEDAFGLKLWNIIQGLRTLRDTGLTRELEVWGMVDGNVVNGVIDGLSYEHPDPQLEEEVLSSRGSQSSQGSQSQQTGITDYFPSSTPSTGSIFITDVKTRAVKYPPSRVQTRGTIIQLFLYHRFLSEMASDKLDYLAIFSRYRLNPDQPFSDAFMAQIGALHEEVFSDDGSSDFVSAVSTASKITSGGPSDELETMKYRTLRELLPLLKFEIQLTFPRGASTLGQIVAVEYRYRARSEDDEANGAIICVNTHYVEQETLDMYLKDTMQWWRGEREPRGVILEEAYKCQSCEFVNDCEWRSKLDQEALRKARVRRKWTPEKW
ncbi:exonuclease V [Podospora appendiculata]|uniref:Exonuclease V n=1 Tax=Podospora appendiculata TaxID=314037 RepID=A0AAE0X785_9PEZI|nr:exonuclease V [Podospora appendiculata]